VALSADDYGVGYSRCSALDGYATRRRRTGRPTCRTGPAASGGGRL